MKIDWLYFNKKNPLSVILVIIQFSSLGYLLFSATPYPIQYFYLLPYFTGIIIGLWAIWVMQKVKINISPDPHPGIKLMTGGPYRWIRHPMYLAIILTVTPLLFEYYRIGRLIVFIILITNLIIKLEHEERMLTHQIPEYLHYRKRTWRLIPLLY